VHHPKIELAVEVVIEPSGGDGPLAVLDTGFRSHVLEVAAANVPIETVAVHACDKQVRKTVVSKSATAVPWSTLPQRRLPVR